MPHLSKTLLASSLALGALLAGCQSSDEKANEELLQSRNSQAAQMNTHGENGQSLPKSDAPATK